MLSLVGETASLAVLARVRLWVGRESPSGRSPYCLPHGFRATHPIPSSIGRLSNDAVNRLQLRRRERIHART